jgi:GH15 family glucan-1,4-alpha-glucosidase
MAWVALDRAVKMIRESKLKGDIGLWQSTRDKMHAEICARGFNKELNAFTQYFGAKHLDASLLMMPLVGFLPASDPRIRGTIEAIQRDLVADGLVLRYHPDVAKNVDGLPAGEGTFLPCSFWLADCLHMIGRHEEARELFTRLLAIRTDLGLLSEEYDTRAGRLVGNFPQAFSHVGLVNTARNLASDAHGPAEKRCENRDEKPDGA